MPLWWIIIIILMKVKSLIIWGCYRGVFTRWTWSSLCSHSQGRRQSRGKNGFAHYLWRFPVNETSSWSGWHALSWEIQANGNFPWVFLGEKEGRSAHCTHRRKPRSSKFIERVSLWRLASSKYLFFGTCWINLRSEGKQEIEDNRLLRNL